MVQGRHVAGRATTNLRDAKEAYRAKVRSILEPDSTNTWCLPSVEEYAWHVLEDVYAVRVSNGLIAARTMELYEQILRLNLRGSDLGRKRMDTVVPADVERWWTGLWTQARVTKQRVFLSRPMSNSSKARYLGMLSAVFNYAQQKEKLIESNPAQEATKPISQPVQFRILSTTEVEDLVDLCQTRRSLGIVLLGLHGVGPAEMCGLQASDFDGEGITIHRQRQRLKHGVQVQEKLKTRKRHAWIAVNDRLREYLADAKEGWVLHGSRSEALEPSHIRRDLSALVNGTQFEGTRPYDLRHTFAQRLLDEGVDVQTAAELLRHSTETFLRRYVRSDRDRKLAAIRRLDSSCRGRGV